MTRALLLLLLVGAPLLAQPASRPSLTGVLKRDLDWLCAPERGGRGRNKGPEAARWVEARFKKLGLRPLFGEDYLQGFRFFALRGNNVGAVLPGTGLGRSHVIVSAHFDHLGVRGGALHPGAADNAAGVAALFHVARALAEGPRLPHDVVFLAFDLEELGMLGARHYARHPGRPLERCLTFTTMDILGREVLGVRGARLVVLGTERAPGLLPLLSESKVPGLETYFVGTDVIGDRSDYVPFRNAGVPFLFFSTGEFADYHTPRDTVERLDLPALALQARYVEGVVRRLAAQRKRPAFRKQALTTAAELESMGRILALLEREGPPALKRMVGTVRPRLAAAKAALAKDALERDTVVGMARGLLLTLRRAFADR